MVAVGHNHAVDAMAQHGCQCFSHALLGSQHDQGVCGKLSDRQGSKRQAQSDGGRQIGGGKDAEPGRRRFIITHQDMADALGMEQACHFGNRNRGLHIMRSVQDRAVDTGQCQ